MNKSYSASIFTLSLMFAGLAAAQSKPALERQYGNLPLRFEANQGQTDPQVRFLSRGQGYSLFLTDSEAVLSLQGKGKSDVVRMQFAGASARTKVVGVDELAGKSNYFIGNDPSKWRKNVPTYRRVSYKDIYPGVDLVYYGNQGKLEYDFVVGAGADPANIRVKFVGTKRLHIEQDGGLAITGSGGHITLGRPMVYQIVDGAKRPLKAQFKLLTAKTVAFRFDEYDRSRPLIIDPTLTYSTYIGGTGYAPPAAGNCCGDAANGIAVDLFGSAYVVGTTGSSVFRLPVMRISPRIMMLTRRLPAQPETFL